MLGGYHSILDLGFSHLHVESQLPKLKIGGRYEPRGHLTRCMLHQVAAMVHFILFVSTIAIMVKDSSPKVLVRIGSLLLIFSILVSGARVLRNDRELEVLVTDHTIVQVAIEHGVVSAKVRGHWHLLIVVH